MNEKVHRGYIADQVSVAYDLSTFDVIPQQNSNAKLLTAVSVRRTEKHVRSMLVSIAQCVFVISMLCGILMSAAKLNEVTALEARAKRENGQLLVEQKRLQTLYDTRIDLKEIERVAVEEMFMQPIEKEQIVYIETAKRDVGTVIADNRSLSQRVTSLLNDSTARITSAVASPLSAIRTKSKN